MRRAWTILAAGVVLAVVAFFGFYYVGTASSRKLEHSPEPELAWLKQEFQLSDVDYTKLCQMHQGYVEGCAERCRKIDEVNVHLRELLAATNTITPEIEQTLLQAAQLRAKCQQEMLRHFYEVSRTMPPEQGRRYLAWVQAQTILPDTHSQMGQQSSRPMDHSHHHMEMDGH
jgi:hypothetical protein